MPYTTEVVWNRRWVDMVIHSVAKKGCDLLLKSSLWHGKVRRAGAYTRRLSDELLPSNARGKAVDSESLGELYNLDPARILLRQGEAIKTLNTICKEIEPSILVIGSIARTGVSARVIGNTAEKLLDLVDADILAVDLE